MTRASRKPIDRAMIDETRPLKRGWTTGACATASAKAACAALLTGDFPDPVEITLPGGHRVAFALATHELRDGEAMAGIVKDAGDDPDVTHGCTVRVTVAWAEPGAGVTFQAGPGVGTVTRPAAASSRSCGTRRAVGTPSMPPSAGTSGAMKRGSQCQYQRPSAPRRSTLRSPSGLIVRWRCGV